MTAARTVFLAVLGAAVASCTAGRLAVVSRGDAAEAYPPAAAQEPVPAAARESVPPPPPAAAPTGSNVDFASQIRPFLQTDCAPCHFEGGKMYGPLPFDKGETIRLLGADKMFTRVKDEHKRDLIRAFLAQQDPA